jgi:2-C-methyl-D-erythritol 4-phosphate cytidylyltransferase
LTIAILLAAGVGARFSSESPKQLFEYKGKPLLAYSLETLCQMTQIEKVVLVVDPETEGKLSEMEILQLHTHKVHIVRGGRTRTDSMLIGIKFALSAEKQIKSRFLVHDSARPFVSKEHFIKILSQKETDQAYVTSSRIYDAYALQKSTGEIRNITEGELVVFQTPILLTREIAEKVSTELSLELRSGLAGLLIDLGFKPALIESDGTTGKITVKKDLNSW